MICIYANNYVHLHNYSYVLCRYRSFSWHQYCDHYYYNISSHDIGMLVKKEKKDTKRGYLVCGYIGSTCSYILELDSQVLKYQIMEFGICYLPDSYYTIHLCHINVTNQNTVEA